MNAFDHLHVELNYVAVGFVPNRGEPAGVRANLEGALLPLRAPAAA
jgi:hypothetical protein